MTALLAEHSNVYIDVCIVAVKAGILCPQWVGQRLSLSNLRSES